ncbi:hypothetical protein EDC04DRAFT_2907561 [Pisolithus marmoratus]|nr:hypothetical protein EDC04DRAFT_2907561 [Pisolithus marmoratus]
MFTRPYTFNQAGRVSSPFTALRSGNPAGLRFPNHRTPCFNLFQGPQFQHTRSPQSSPFSSPVRGGISPLPEDDAPPKKTIFNEFPGFTPPPRAANSRRPHKRFQPQKPSPPVAPATAARPPSVKPSPRKRFGYKRLTINREAVCSALRNQERIRQKKIARHERLAAQARANLQHMRDQVEKTMHGAVMTNEDKIFAQQLRRLHLDSVFRNDLSRYRETAERAENETPRRLEVHAEMENDAEHLREQVRKDAEREEELRIIRKMREDQEKKRQEEERVRVEEARRRAREERERLEYQCKLLEEQRRKAKAAQEREAREREAREREAREREARERVARENEAREREARERATREREAREREEREREASEREARERQAREREARARAEAVHSAQANPQALQQLFVLYEAKWAELKINHALSSIDVRELPWPSLALKYFTAQELTREDVYIFIFHSLRPCPVQKSAKDRVRAEVLRFHPDKFNAFVLPKVREDQRALAQELAGAAVRALTTIMAETD